MIVFMYLDLPFGRTMHEQRAQNKPMDLMVWVLLPLDCADTNFKFIFIISWWRRGSARLPSCKHKHHVQGASPCSNHEIHCNIPLDSNTPGK